MIFRAYQRSDCARVAQLFYETVHTVNAKNYSAEQLEVWAPTHMNLSAWNESLSAHIAIVAEEGGQIVGFGDIDGGYLDRLYVHKDFQRRGIGTQICERLENSMQADRIITYSSITAKPFFLKRGYRIVKENEVVRQGVSLTNYLMEKLIR